MAMMSSELTSVSMTMGMTDGDAVADGDAGPGVSVVAGAGTDAAGAGVAAAGADGLGVVAAHAESTDAMTATTAPRAMGSSRVLMVPPRPARSSDAVCDAPSGRPLRTRDERRRGRPLGRERRPGLSGGVLHSRRRVRYRDRGSPRP
jgi:hypothetical protein